MRGLVRISLGALALVVLASCSAPPSGPATSVPRKIDETQLVALRGNMHPLAIAVNDFGPADDALPLEHLQLVLKRSPEREAALDGLLDQLHDPKSPSFHRWLTPQEFADSYGVPDEDVTAVTAWLQARGLRVDNVASSRMFIEFSGSAGAVSKTFHTPIHKLSIEGALHFANMSEPQIPAALSDVVVGVHALHDFKPQPMHKDIGPVKRDGKSGRWGFVGTKPTFTIPDGSNGTYYGVTPGDFATIYNLNPLFSGGTRGAGQTIAVIEDTNIANASDVTSFRQAFGLSGYAGTFSQVHPTGPATCTNPGVNSDEGEAALDAEWAGAAAPDATIVLASCQDTSTVFGGLPAIQNLINSANPPQIISISYGICEIAQGSAGSASFANAYKQAAAEGVSVFVSSGDEGAAGCDANQKYAQFGINVNGMASTPYNVAVGGTDFMDEYDAKHGGPGVGTYWQASNSSTFASAKSYIPEIPWNSSCASQLIYTTAGFTQPYGSTGFCSSPTGIANFLTTASGSGGPSSVVSQPSWQTGVPGLPTASGGFRYLPDVSLFASNGVWGHFYVYCMSDTAQGGVACNYTNTSDTLALAAGGTSFAAPALAGIQALVNQKAGSRQGNPNYSYYRIAGAELREAGTCNSDQGAPDAATLPPSACVFNDVTLGDIAVPCIGTNNCYGYSHTSHPSATYYGALSTTSSGTYNQAYGAARGWDYATGLGSLNAYALVTNWAGSATDAGVDGAADAASEASSDATVDATSEAAAEAGSDAGADSSAGSDSAAGTDSGGDAVAEAGPDGGLDAAGDSGLGTGACGGATLSASPGSPQNAGTPVTLTAGSSTCGNPQYEFWERSPGGNWNVVQSWSSNSSYTWNTTGLADGTYGWQVYVREASSTAQ
ncbi:MAG TPA: S53 family peptidase, partial [Polyangiaceae bacterium]|nr:S53 family peptidase [Polyangiaceae bacterium]